MQLVVNYITVLRFPLLESSEVLLEIRIPEFYLSCFESEWLEAGIWIFKKSLGDSYTDSVAGLVKILKICLLVLHFLDKLPFNSGFKFSCLFKIGIMAFALQIINSCSMNPKMLTEFSWTLVETRSGNLSGRSNWGSGLGHLWKAELNCWV